MPMSLEQESIFDKLLRQGKSLPGEILCVKKVSKKAKISREEAKPDR